MQGIAGALGPARQMAGSAAARLARVAADLVLPPSCLICHAPCLEPAALCDACWTRLRFIEEPCCPRLGIPFAYETEPGEVSAAALADPPVWDSARAAVAYDDASKELVHGLKYRDRHEAAALMARLMARSGAGLLDRAEAVIPVPLHRFRLWRRRYNQSALLAQRIAIDRKRTFAPLWLRRIKATRAQVGLDYDARRKNVRRAFAVPEWARSEIAGRRILLVDDVMTTGATAAACTEALRRAGAKHVDVLAFALVLEPKRFHI